MRTIPILFTFTENLLMPAGVCLTSLLENAGPDTFYDIFILHEPDPRIPGSKLKNLASHYGNCRFTFREVRGEFEGGYNIRGIPETAYYRLLAPEMIPEYDKILYSDVDVIFREDLSKYYAIDLKDNYFAGVDSLPAINADDLLKLGFSVINEIPGLFLIMRQPESHTCLLLSSSEERKCGAIVKANVKGFNGKGGGRDDNARAIFPSTADMDAFIKEISSQN